MYKESSTRMLVIPNFGSKWSLEQKKESYYFPWCSVCLTSHEAQNPEQDDFWRGGYMLF